MEKISKKKEKQRHHHDREEMKSMNQATAGRQNPQAEEGPRMYTTDSSIQMRRERERLKRDREVGVEGETLILHTHTTRTNNDGKDTTPSRRCEAQHDGKFLFASRLLPFFPSACYI